MPGSKNYVEVSTLSQFKSCMVRANRPRRANSLLDHQHHLPDGSQHLQLCERSPNTLELSLCWHHLDPRGLVKGSPMLYVNGYSLSRSLTRLETSIFRLKAERGKKTYP